MLRGSKQQFINISAIILVTLFSVSNLLAADFTLAWDPNCNDYPNLIGYNIYFKAGSSVVNNPDNSHLVYIALPDHGFDPDNPSYRITGLQDDVEYFFSVTAQLEDTETGMSNEVSAINGVATYASSVDSSSGAAGSADAGGGGGGCFISSLR